MIFELYINLQKMSMKAGPIRNLLFHASEEDRYNSPIFTSDIFCYAKCDIETCGFSDIIFALKTGQSPI